MCGLWSENSPTQGKWLETIRRFLKEGEKKEDNVITHLGRPTHRAQSRVRWGKCTGSCLLSWHTHLHGKAGGSAHTHRCLTHTSDTQEQAKIYCDSLFSTHTTSRLGYSNLKYNVNLGQQKYRDCIILFSQSPPWIYSNDVKGRLE